MIAQSQSGTGKTAAFLLSALFRVNSSLNYPQVLILSPTYELALQTGEVAKRLAKHRPDITFAFALRGEIISREPIRDHVVFGTPGKVLDWGLRNRRFDLKQITVFVLDEADVMINIQGHRQQSLMIRKALSTNCQMLLFSATYDTEVMEFAETIIPDPVIIRLKRFEETLKNIGQYYVKCTSELEKYTALRNLFAVLSMGQAFIFCETKRSAHWLCERLKSDGHAVGVISGDLTVEERNAVIFKFREGMERVLIATNVVARGIDVDQVTIVVNYDLPVCHETREVDYDTYLHRIGRSGRFGKSGLAVNLIDGPQTLAMIKKLNDHFGIEIQPLDASDADEIERISAD